MTNTPGPWETSEAPHAKGEDIGHPKSWTYVRHNFPDAPYEGELNDEWGIYPPLGERGPVALVAGKGNAQLISAAPDMLKALKHVRSQPCPKDTNGDGDCGQVLCPFCGKLIRDAIANAGGK